MLELLDGRDTNLVDKLGALALPAKDLNWRDRKDC